MKTNSAKTSSVTKAKKIVQKETRTLQQIEKLLKASDLRCESLTDEVMASRQYFSNFLQTIILQQEAEKREISRELHDEIAQMLTGINFELAILSKEAANSTKILQEKVLHAQKLVGASVEVIHDFARELRPLVLDDLGLVAAIQAYVKEFSKKSSIKVKFNTNFRTVNLEDFVKTVFFRVTQESLNNVFKHAEATNVSIKLSKQKSNTVLVIHDNGKSFKVDKFLTLAHNGRIGIRGMIERVKLVNGTLEIKSAPGKGTTITVQIPDTKS
jgi:signal transduction histidine kinase